TVGRGAADLLFGLVVATYGIDLSPGLFRRYSGLSYFKLVNVFFESQPNPVALFMRAVITAAAKTDDWGADLMNSEPPRRARRLLFLLRHILRHRDAAR